MSAETRQAPSDAERLSRWVQDHAPAVLGFLRGTLRRPDQAEEVMQETFCRAWEARSRYVETGQERAYLLKIADRLACDRLRRRGREVTLDENSWVGVEPGGGSDPANRLVRDERARQLAFAMDALSESQRRVLLLRFYGDLQFSDIAEATGWPMNTVLSHCRRGLLALRELMIKDPS